MQGGLMHVTVPGSLRDIWGLSYPARLRTAQTKELTHTHTGCGFSRSYDSFRLTKDSGQGSEKSGWLTGPCDFTWQRRIRRGGGVCVTVQIPETLQWDVGSGLVAVIYGLGVIGTQLLPENRIKGW